MTPADAEGRPGESGPRSNTDQVGGPTDSVGDGLGRRRDAALRLPALDDGRRDPLDPDGTWRYSRRGVELAADHLSAAGLLDDLVAELLRRQWREAAA